MMISRHMIDTRCKGHARHGVGGGKKAAIKTCTHFNDWREGPFQGGKEGRSVYVHWKERNSEMNSSVMTIEVVINKKEKN